MINRDAIRRLEEAGIDLGANALLIIYGGLPVEEIKGYIASQYRPYRTGKRDPSKSTEDYVQEVQTNLSVAAMGGTAGVTLALSKIRDRLQFETMPGLQVASQAAGGFAQAYLDAARTREQILFDYGQMGGWAATGLYALSGRALYSRLFDRLQKFGRGARRVEQAEDVVSFMRNARKVTRLTARTGAGLLSFIAGELVFTAGEQIARRAMSGYANTMAAQSFASRLMDRQLVVDDFMRARVPLVDVGGDVNNMYGELDRLRNKTSLYGLSPKEVGSDYQAITQSLTQISQTAHFQNRQHYMDYATNVNVLGEVYGVGSEAIMPIFADLAMSGFREKDINEAREEFEKFFVSLVGGEDRTPNTAQLQLVQELSTFARGYGFGTKLSDNAPEELAKIHQFVTGGVAQNMQVTQPTQDLVRGIDSMLESGGTGQNAAVQDLMRVSGITNFQAIKGVTTDAGTMNKFFHGITATMGLGLEDFNAQGQLNDKKLRQFYPMMTELYGADQQTTQAVMAGAHAYLKGYRAEDVRATYLRAFEENYAADIQTSPIYSLMTNIVEQDTELVKQIKNALPVLNQMDDFLVTVFTEHMPNVVQITANFAATTNDLANKFSRGEAIERPSEIATGQVLPGFSPIGYPTGAGNLLSAISPEYSDRLHPRFINEVMNVSSNIGARPDYLLAIMGFETGYSFDPSQRNLAGSSATGLIQFMASTAVGLGTTTAALAKMSQVEQLQYVQKYFEQFNLPSNPTLSDLYMAVLWPAAIGKDENYVLWREYGDYSRQYQANKGLDINRDHLITKGEATQKVMNAYIELFGRATGGATSGGSQSTSMVEYTSNDNNVLIDIEADFVDRAALARHLEQYFYEAVG